MLSLFYYIRSPPTRVVPHLSRLFLYAVGYITSLCDTGHVFVLLSCQWLRFWGKSPFKKLSLRRKLWRFLKLVDGLWTRCSWHRMLGDMEWNERWRETTKGTMSTFWRRKRGLFVARRRFMFIEIIFRDSCIAICVDGHLRWWSMWPANCSRWSATLNSHLFFISYFFIKFPQVYLFCLQRMDCLEPPFPFLHSVCGENPDLGTTYDATSADECIWPFGVRSDLSMYRWQVLIVLQPFSF